MKHLSIQENKPSMGISIYEYVAFNNPGKIDALLKQHGMPGSKKRAELAFQLSNLCEKEGTPVQAEIIELHPDREVFEAINKAAIEEAAAKEEEEETEPGKFANACGCSIGFDGFVNCEGKKDNCCQKDKPKPLFQNVTAEEKAPAAPAPVATKLPEKPAFFNTTNIAIIGVITVAVAVILSKSK